MSDNIYGNLKGLQPSHIKQLQQLSEQRQPSDRPIAPEFAQKLAAISTEIHQPVCSYINRRGQVVRVGVGTPQQTQIPPKAAIGAIYGRRRFISNTYQTVEGSDRVDY